MARERPYEPQKARWTSVDRLANASGQAPYVYANNNPLAFIDPSGRLAQSGDLEKKDCGAYDWKTKWKLKDSERDGFIIQFVRVRQQIRACDEMGTVQPGEGPCATSHAGGVDQFGYFEVWYVDKDGNLYWDAGGMPPKNKIAADSHHDVFNVGSKDKTQGCHKKYGEAIFVKAADMRWPLDKTDAKIENAGDLLALCSGQFFNLFNDLRRKAVSSLSTKVVERSWKCCPSDDPCERKDENREFHQTSKEGDRKAAEIGKSDELKTACGKS